MLQDLAPWAGAIIALGTLTYTIISQRSKAAAEKVSQLDERVDRLEDRSTRLESTIQHLPDKDITHRLEMSIQGLRTEVQVLSERVKPVAAIAGRLQEVILEKAGT